MDNAWNIAQEGQYNVDPEMLAESYLEENSQGRKEYSQNDSQDIHGIASFSDLAERIVLAAG